MTPARFNALLNGPLWHPFPPFALTRLQLALFYVIEQCGKQAEDALEEYCIDLGIRDRGEDKI